MKKGRLTQRHGEIKTIFIEKILDNINILDILSLKRYFVKNLIFVIMIFFVRSLIFSQEMFEFRGFKWGTDYNNIISAEGSPDEISDLANVLVPNIARYPGIKVIHYNNKMVSNYNAKLSFSFFDNRLNEGKYEIIGYSTQINYISNNYIDLRNKLKILYGENEYNYMEDNGITNDEIIANINLKYNQNINNNNTRWYQFHKTNWFYNDTFISLTLFYNYLSGEYTINIEYRSRQSVDDLNESSSRAEQLRNSTEGL